MRLYHLSLLLIFAGIALLFYAVAIGEANASLFLIFPVIYGSGVYSLLAIFLIMIGMILLFFAPLQSLKENVNDYYEKDYDNYDYVNYESYKGTKDFEEYRENKARYGGVVLIGPIPIIFGSDKNMAKMSILGAILMLVAIFLIFFLYG